MTDEENKTNESTHEDKMKKKLANEQNEAKQTINAHTMEIKTLSDTITELLEKEDFTEEDLDRAFELADEIQEQYEDVIALLFKIRDTLPLSSET